MSTFSNQGMDEDNFGEPSSISVVKAFDAFPKTKQTYLTRTRNGGIWTIVFTVVCAWLTISELRRWMTGTTKHSYSVEQGISHDLQINFDATVAMRCQDVHINVQDAAGDHILAGQSLQKDPTLWSMWPVNKQQQKYLEARERREKARKKKQQQRLAQQQVEKNQGSKATRKQDLSMLQELGDQPDWMEEQAKQYTTEEDVHDFLVPAGRRGKKFLKTPKLPRDAEADACRIYGSLEGNKVQGDFHITARGHGYMEMGLGHLSHAQFNFSHYITELSFGPHYPSMHNPLDAARSTTAYNFYKFQYYLSIVPTIYTDRAANLARLTTSSPPHIRTRNRVEHPDQVALLESVNPKHFHFNPLAHSPHTIYTNQYAVTEQSRPVPESVVPGIFIKYDIEPILLTVAEEWGGFLGMLVRLVNVIAGVLVAGGWVVALLEFFQDSKLMRRGGVKRAFTDSGILRGEKGEKDANWQD